MNTRAPRLLSLNTYHYRRGGSDVAFLEHVKLFEQLGWETAVFAMHHPNNEPSPWSDYFADEIEFGFDYSLPRKAAMAGKVVYSFEARRKLSRLVDRWRPDIAHAHCVYHHLSPSVLSLLRKRGIPTVMTAHDLKVACPAYKMLNRTGICERCKHGNLTHVVRHRCIQDSVLLSSLIMVESAVHKLLGLYRRNLDRIVVPSRFYREKLMEWGWPAEQLVHIPNFIAAGDFAPDYRPGDYFLYFGRLAPEKGVDKLIAAAVASGVQVKIAGSGHAEGDLRVLAGEADNVEFVGYRSGAALWELVRGSRAVVLPSQWYENAPLSILESFACGKPVIGARIGGIVELVREGETGFLFAHDDVADLADRLFAVAAMPADALRDLGERARELVATEFTREHYVDAILALYAELGVDAPERRRPPRPGYRPLPGRRR